VTFGRWSEVNLTGTTGPDQQGFHFKVLNLLQCQVVLVKKKQFTDKHFPSEKHSKG